MMQVEVKDIVEKSLEKARDHDRTGNVGKAYAYYTVVAELCPEKRTEIEKAFTDVLCEWGIQLAHNNRFQDVSLCYQRSLDIYPNNTRMLNNFAAHLLRNDDPMGAITYLKRALTLDFTFLPAERNLQNAYSMAVDRWHFTMLNDKRRNNAFEQAIRKRISQGYDNVLDIGTGTGLLSLYAKDAGAKQVYACECSPIMATIAKEVFKQNDAADIKLIPKLSSCLEIPTDIPERVRLIVTETFDAGLFGELVVPSMINAHVNILDTDGMGMVIPMSATLYSTAAECEYIRYRSSVVFDRIRDNCCLNFNGICVLPDDEYYDTENLENVKINYVTEPQALLTVNFNDLNELEQFSMDGVKGVVQSTCRYDGIIDGLVTWFKLHLDEEITLDSSAGKSCWQSAVFPVIPTVCKQGDVLSIIAEMCQDKLKCSYSSNSSVRQDQSDFVYRLPKEIIAFLNDSAYVKLLSTVGSSHAECNIKNVLDTSPFPIYGLTVLKENQHCETLYYETENKLLRSFIEQVAKNSGIDGRVRFISNYSEIDCSLQSVFIHNFDIKGELKDWGRDSCRDFFSSLLDPNGILLPEKIYLMGQLVYSEDLPKMVCVNDENLQRMPVQTSDSSTCSSEKYSDEEVEPIQESLLDCTHYKIADYINEFKIDQVFDLNSSLYLYESISEAKVLTQIVENETVESIVRFEKINGTEKKLVPNVLICWYKVYLTTDHIHDTKGNESFMNHTAIVLEKELKNVITHAKDVELRVFQTNSLIKITVLNT